jgi:hypothetical protein
MAIGLQTLNPGKLDILFPDIQQPQKRIAWDLFKHLGADWIAKARESYHSGGGIELRGNKSAVEALMQKLASLPHDLFPPSNYTFIEPVLQNICSGVTCLIDISGLRSEDQNRVVCLCASTVAEHYKRMWEEHYEDWRKLPTLLITVEEAHEFLDPNKPKTIFSDIALTYRKYRVGLNAVTPRPSRINFDVFAELWTKVIMKTELKKDRIYLTENTPYMEYSETEIKMLDVGEALLISEPKIKFAVPVKVTHYPEYLEKLTKAVYSLPDSSSLSEMDKRLRNLNAVGKNSPE